MIQLITYYKIFLIAQKLNQIFYMIIAYNYTLLLRYYIIDIRIGYHRLKKLKLNHSNLT